MVLIPQTEKEKYKTKFYLKMYNYNCSLLKICSEEKFSNNKHSLDVSTS